MEYRIKEDKLADRSEFCIESREGEDPFTVCEGFQLVESMDRAKRNIINAKKLEIVETNYYDENGESI